MARHLARRGGIWWARLTVPARLRPIAGRREFIQSCKTGELSLAKTVAAILIAEWRQSLMRLESKVMDSPALKLLQPAPLLGIGATITLAEAENYGVDRIQLLRIAAAGKLVLHCRLGLTQGYLLNPQSLQDDPTTGGKDIPLPRCMPADAVEAVKSGVLAIPDSRQVANAILVDGIDPATEIVVLEVTPTNWFIPSQTLRISVNALEVSAEAVTTIRGYLAKKLPQVEIDRLIAVGNTGRDVKKAESFGPHANILFSAAVNKYCADPDGLPQRLASETEIRQRKNAMLWFVEFMGDLPLYQITADVLRRYRDGPLRQIPAKTNNLPKELKRSTMLETIQAIKDAGIEMPTLSLGVRQERMAHLSRLFAWLHAKGWLNSNPAAALQGETGMTKAQRNDEKRRLRVVNGSGDDEEGRPPFTGDELRLIFNQPHYQNGDGRHVSKGNATWYPFEYWLPLLGLYAGCRIGEVSQLHLDDVREAQGVWVLDLNENTPDKRLKTDKTSIRLIPIHPKLIELGFLGYCARLRAENYRRVFPELTYSASDARYAKEPIRKMSAMLKGLGMPRTNDKVFHCLRHNANDALMRVPMAALPFADETLRKFIRHKILGHQQAGDVNAQNYTSSSIQEAASLIRGMSFDLPLIAKFDIDFGVEAVKEALLKKRGPRFNREDMGPASD